MTKVLHAGVKATELEKNWSALHGSSFFCSFCLSFLFQNIQTQNQNSIKVVAGIFKRAPAEKHNTKTDFTKFISKEEDI